MFEWRNLVCGAMIVILPASAVAQDLGRAMLHSDGGVWLNGNPAPKSTAIFPHDLVQTPKGSVAKIDAQGATITIQSGTRVQFEEEELFLDSGSLQVNSARGMRVRVNCMTVIPPAQGWTRYDVSDADGKLTVVAYESDIKIHYRRVVPRPAKDAGTSDVTVHRGEHVVRDERCRAGSQPAAVDGYGPLLNSPWAIGAGAVAVGALTCFALCRDPEPVSPDTP